MNSHYDTLVEEVLVEWRKFPRMTREGALGLLTHEHATAFAMDCFIGQVNNGGFAQWIDNHYAICMHEIVYFLLLRKIDTELAKQVALMIRTARRITDDFTSEITDDDAERLDKLDMEFYKIDDAFKAEVENYFQQFAPQEIEYNI